MVPMQPWRQGPSGWLRQLVRPPAAEDSEVASCLIRHPEPSYRFGGRPTRTDIPDTQWAPRMARGGGLVLAHRALLPDRPRARAQAQTSVAKSVCNACSVALSASTMPWPPTG